jgi:hypothetical protein
MPDEDKQTILDAAGPDLAARPLVEIPEYIHRGHLICDIIRSAAYVLLAIALVTFLVSRAGETDQS